MDGKLFTSSSRWFTFLLPVDWEEYDDDEEGTYAFFNANNWTGNFRVTVLKSSNAESDMTASLLKSELAENEEAEQRIIGNYQTVSYKKEIQKENEPMVIYYRILGKGNTVFICSFTIDKNMDGSKENDNELELIEEIIASISIN